MKGEGTEDACCCTLQSLHCFHDPQIGTFIVFLLYLLMFDAGFLKFILKKIVHYFLNS